jgi:hypothetical protein
MHQPACDRSGVPELDEAIEAFRERGLWHVPVMDWLNDGYVEQARPLEELTTPLGARGNCVHLTEEFNEFLRERGLEALSPADEAGRPTALPPEALGYADRSLAGLPGHTFSVVEAAGALYSVDWTAAQYGYRSFPLVQRFDGRQWRRLGRRVFDQAA